jgi:hypothetical protein
MNDWRVSRARSRVVVGVLAVVLGAVAASGQEDPRELSVRLIDSQGRPVAFAEVGMEANEREGRWTWNVGPEVSDDRGWVRCPSGWWLQSRTRGEPKIELYARSEDRTLVGLREISKADLAKDPDIRMVEPCHVTGGVDSTELRGLGHEALVCHAVLWTPSPGLTGFMHVSSANRSGGPASFEFLVPPGKYRLRCSAFCRASQGATDELEKGFEVQQGCKELSLGTIDVPATQLTKLMGKPAPELEGIQAWKNGGPLTLASLRGKVVLLHFWIYWCDRVYPQIHHLLELYDAIRQQNLDVEIIVIHDGRFSSFDELQAAFNADPNCVKVRQDYWGGKDLPFTMAIDSREPARYLGGETWLRGVNWDHYGVSYYPQTFIIDRQGRLAGHLGSLDVGTAFTQLRPYLTDPAKGGDVVRQLPSCGIRFAEGSLQGKRLLICLFDLQQRPSRNAVIQLAKKTEALKAAGVEVVAIQMSKVDEGTLAAWKKETAVPFQVGMVQAGDEKARMAWGAESLPWLILTDKELRVVAEGFAVSDLEGVLGR